MEFYDSTRPGLIPARAPALLYYDGRYRATAAAAKRFSLVRWITIAGGAPAADHTGVIDFEPGNLAFEGNQLREWAQARQAMKCRARVYTDLANAAAAHERVGDLPNVVYWLAAYGPKLTAGQVVTVLRARGADVAEARIWGLQFAGGVLAAYDTSVLYGAW